MKNKNEKQPDRAPFAYEVEDSFPEIVIECDYHLKRLQNKSLKSQDDIKKIDQFTQIKSIALR